MPAVFCETIDNSTFLAYVAQVLVPSLTAGDVVVLENLARPQTTCRALQFLPPYSLESIRSNWRLRR